MMIAKDIYLKKYKDIYIFFSFKGEHGTAELGANTVLKQTNELCF